MNYCGLWEIKVENMMSVNMPEKKINAAYNLGSSLGEFYALNFVPIERGQFIIEEIEVVHPQDVLSIQSGFGDGYSNASRIVREKLEREARQRDGLRRNSRKQKRSK